MKIAKNKQQNSRHVKAIGCEEKNSEFYAADPYLIAMIKNLQQWQSSAVSI